MSKLVFDDIITAHHYKAFPGCEYHTETRAREDYGIVFVINSRAVYSFPNAECAEVRNENCLYLPRGSKYTTKSGSDGFGPLTVNFSTGGDYPLSSHWFSLQIEVAKKEVRQIFEKLIHEWYKRRPYYREKCLGYFYEITFVLLMEKQELPREQLKKSNLHAHIWKSISKEHTIARSGRSVRYFPNIFLPLISDSFP